MAWKVRSLCSGVTVTAPSMMAATSVSGSDIGVVAQNELSAGRSVFVGPVDDTRRGDVGDRGDADTGEVGD